MAIPVRADADRGNITINLNDIGTDRASVGFRLYQVADTADGYEWYWRLTGVFADAPVDLNALDKADDYRKAAETLASWKGKESAVSETGKTDKDGKLTFTGLPIGIYLIEQTDKASYGTVLPFLAAIPSCEKEGALQYEVTAYVKGDSTPGVSVSPEPNVTETPGDSGSDNSSKDGSKAPSVKDTGGIKKKSAKTGDSSHIEYYAAATVLAAALILLLLYQKHRRK
nr:SpaA isopeptide-forming pilin-related protein [Blautia sp. MSJ-19]